MRFGQWFAESEAADFDSYDLQQKYQQYNQMLFDGKLPTIPIEYANIKAGGIVHATILLDPQNLPNQRLVRLGLQSKYHGGSIKPGTLRMQISRLFKRSEAGLDAILIHEMIHVYFHVIGDHAENHGPKFVKMCKELGEVVGFAIPLTDDIPKLGLADESKVKTLGVHLVKKGESYSVALVSDKYMRENAAALVERWDYFVKYKHADSAQCFLITSLKWTELSHKFPVQRKAPAKLGYFSLAAEDAEALAELLEKGELLGAVP